MSNVDDRIVRMQFDNSGFEAGATKAIDLLGKLNEALKFDDMSDGLGKVRDNIRGFNMGNVSDQVESCRLVFSKFDAFTFGVITNLGRRFEEFANRTLQNVKNTMIRGAKDGFGEYEQQINSIQTIAANSGEEMSVITESLDKLNEYADKTVYKFGDMTSAIGRFTAAGIGVQDSTAAIQGFANAAALAGAGPAEMSRGIYQLSQAMSAGVVKLQDWKSIENASIDTAQFRDVIITTAKAMGVTNDGFDKLVKGEKSFRESLSDGWLTAEVMQNALENLTMSTRDFDDEAKGMEERMKTLTKKGYSEDVAKKLIEIANAADDSAREIRTWSQLIDTMGEAIGTGWADTWKIVLGGMEDATVFFTTLSQRFEQITSRFSKARNKMLQDWADNGGRNSLIGIVFNLIEAIDRPLQAIGAAFNSVFVVSGQQLAVITENIALFTEKLVMSEKTANAFGNRFAVIFSIFHSVIGVVGNLIRAFVKFAKEVKTRTSRAWQPLIADIQKVIDTLAETLNGMHAFTDGVISLFGGFVRPISRALRQVIYIIDSMVKGLLDNSVIANLGRIFLAIEKGAEALIAIFLDVFSIAGAALRILNPFINFISYLGGRLLGVLAPAMEYVARLLSTASWEFGKFTIRIVQSFNLVERVLTDGVSIVKDFITAFINVFKESSIFKGIVGIFNTIKNALVNLMRSSSIFRGGIETFILNPLEKVHKFLKDFGKGDGVKNRVEFFENALRTIGSVITGPFSFAFGLLKTAFNWLSEHLSGPLSFAFGIASDAFSNLVGSFGFVKDKIGEVNGFLQTFASGIPDFASSIVSKVGEFGSYFFGQAKDYIKGSKTLRKAKTNVNSFSKKTLPVLSNSLVKFKDKFLSVISTVKNYFKTLTPAKLGGDLSKLVDTIVSKIKDFSPRLASGLFGFAETLKSIFTSITENAANFGDVFANIGAAISSKIGELPAPIQALWEQIANTFAWGKDRITEEAGKLSFDNIGINFANLGKNLGEALSGITDGILSVPDMAGNVFDDIVAKASDFVAQFPSLDKIGDASELVLKGGLIASLIKFTNSFGKVNTSFADMTKSIAKWPDAFVNGMKGFGQQFGKYESKADAILKVAGALALLAGALFVLASIPSDDLAKAGKAMGALAVGLLGTLAVFEALEKAKFFNPAMLTAVGAAFSGVAIGVLALAVAAAILSYVPQEKLEQGIPVIVELMAALSLYALALRSNGKSLLAGSIGMIIFAGALHLMVGVVEKLGDIDKDKVDQGVQAFIGIMTGLAIFGAFGAKGISKLLGSFMRFGIGIALLSVSLIILSAAIETIKASFDEMAGDSLKKTLKSIVAFVVGFTLMSLLLKKADPVSVGLGLLAFAGAIAVMALAIAGLSAISNIKTAVAGVVMLFALIGEFALIADKVDSAKLVSTAASMIYLGAALLIMAGACKILASVGEQMGIVATALVLIMLIMGEFAIIAGLVHSEDLVSAGYAMVALGASILIMAAAFKVLETVNMENLIAPLIAVVALIGVFAGAAALLGPATAFLIPAATGILIFSAAILALAAAFWLFADGLNNLNRVGPERTAELMAGFGEGLGKILDELIARLPDLLMALVQGLINGASQLAGAALALIEKFGYYCMLNSSQLLIAGFELIKMIGQGIVGAAGVVAEKAPEVIEWLVNNLGPFAGSLMDAGKWIIDMLASGLGNVGDTFKNLGGNIVDFLKEGFNNLAPDWLKAGLDAATSFFNTIAGFFIVNSPSKKMSELGGFVVQGMIDGIGEKVSSLGTKALEMGTAVLNGVASLPGWVADTAKNAAGGFVEKIGSYVGTAGTKAKALANGASEGLKKFGTGAKTAVEGGVKNFISGISGKANAAKTATATMVNGTKGGLTPAAKQFKSQGTAAAKGFTQGISSAAGAARGAARNLVHSSVSGLSGAGGYGAFYRNGSYVAQGFVHGMRSQLAAVRSIAAQMMSTAAKANAKTGQIKSPSRVFMRLGKYVGQGFAIGMEKTIPQIWKSATEMAEAAPDAFSDTLKSLSINMDDLLETDYNPVITPVIDPTQFDSDMSSLTTMLNNRMPDNFNVGSVNYSQQFAAKLADYADVNKQAMEAFANNAIDYDQLGVSVVNALIRSGVHVEMDGGQLMGYLAGEIRDARRMYG